VTLAPGKSAQVSFTVTPQQLSWWSESANGWTQTPGAYQVYVGDSSALAGLPLRGGFTVTATPGARQVSVSAPSAVTAGKPFAVKVTLTAAGDQTLANPRISLQLPPGWTARPASAAQVVHATADLGGSDTRQAGVSVTVGG
jgi:hypothetical protein